MEGSKVELWEVACGNALKLTPVIHKACECFGLKIGKIEQSYDGETCDGVDHIWPTVSVECDSETAWKLKDALQFAHELSVLWKAG